MIQTFGCDQILPPCNYCHHPWCVGHKSYHKVLLIMSFVIRFVTNTSEMITIVTRSKNSIVLQMGQYYTTSPYRWKMSPSVRAKFSTCTRVHGILLGVFHLKIHVCLLHGQFQIKLFCWILKNRKVSWKFRGLMKISFPSFFFFHFFLFFQHSIESFFL